jgi:uncharacterized membrane protein
MPWGLTPAHLIVMIMIIMIMASPIAILLFALRRNSGGQLPAPYDPAVEELRLRYGRGEITQVEFEEGVALLHSHRRT